MRDLKICLLNLYINLITANLLITLFEDPFPKDLENKYVLKHLRLISFHLDHILIAIL